MLTTVPRSGRTYGENCEGDLHPNREGSGHFRRTTPLDLRLYPV
jgi:hypothetical protein